MLLSVQDELHNATTKEFWEVSERGSNFTFLEPKLRGYLKTFYSWFDWHAEHEDMRARYSRTTAGIALKIDQEVSNFETTILTKVEEQGEDEDQPPDEEVLQDGFDNENEDE